MEDMKKLKLRGSDRVLSLDCLSDAELSVVRLWGLRQIKILVEEDLIPALMTLPKKAVIVGISVFGLINCKAKGRRYVWRYGDQGEKEWIKMLGSTSDEYDSIGLFYPIYSALNLNLYTVESMPRQQEIENAKI